MQRSPNDKIRFALIGAGGMGRGDTTQALALGNELVAVADIYDGRLIRAKEVWGKQVATTRDYRELIARKDIDAVIVATPDHWHSRITIDSLMAGKDVFCQKPMIHKIAEGLPVIEAQKKSGRILQIGSQYVSSIIFEKVGQLLRDGAIGEMNLIESWLDRNTAMGAWQYSIPPDASPANIDWDTYLGNAPKRPFEPIRLFRWRNYSDYGTGVAGDLFVHLLSGIHFATGSMGPRKIFASGGVRFWKDGRDAADVMLAVLDYEKWTLGLRVNLASSEAEEKFGFRFVGSEGIIKADMTGVTLIRHPRETEPGFGVGGFAEATQKEFIKNYYAKYPQQKSTADGMRPDKEEKFLPPRGYDAHREHHRNFWTSLRTRKQFIEDGVFGFRAAGPSLLCNMSLAAGKALDWDPVAMKA